jgi:hypothetical protein
MEPELHRSTINTYGFLCMTEPLPDELIDRISPILRSILQEIAGLLPKEPRSFGKWKQITA